MTPFATYRTPQGRLALLVHDKEVGTYCIEGKHLRRGFRGKDGRWIAMRPEVAIQWLKLRNVTCIRLFYHQSGYKRLEAMA